MCDPFTLGIASAGISAVGSLATGMMGANAANANAQALDRQAALRREKGEYDAAQAMTRYERQRGQNIALVGTTGLSITSLADTFADSAIEAQLEQSAIRWSARNESDNLQTQANNQRYQGQAAMIGGIFGAVGNFVGGTARAFGAGNGTGTGQVGVNNWSTTFNQNFRG